MDENPKTKEQLEEEREEQERQRILAQYISYPDWKMSLIAVAVIGLIYLLFFF